MNTISYAIVLAAALAAAPALAQPKGAVVGESVEALVTVVAVDKKARSVVVRGPRGNTLEIVVPKEAQNFDKIKQGDVFRMRYAEAVAVAITKGGEPAKGDAKGMKMAEKGANPGGVVARTRFISGVIDAIDYKSRYVAVRGPKQTVSLKAGDDVKLEELHAGDRISISYTQALAIEMVPAPAKPKPKAKAAPKKE